jgi:glutamate---cysteine ligase / carboxylate-amine ligase
VKPTSCWLHADCTPEALRSTFDRAMVSLTVGVEEELMLVDPSSGALVPRIDDVLRRTGGDDRFRAELRAAQIELVSRPYLSAADVGRELAATRIELAGMVGEEISLVASGSHPIATAPGPITNGDRYEAIALDNPWAALHMLTCGLHIHVAVAGGERALAVHNALRSYLPELAALSANSPYRGGRHTGIASTRLQLNRSLVRHGVPPVFESWDAYAAFVEWGFAGGSIPDPSYHWWDLRLHPGFGTLEIRISDTQTEISDTVALVALAQALVAWLEARHDAGERLPVHDGYRITESIWLGMRAGDRAELLDLDTGARQSVPDRVAGLVERLEPTACELGTSDVLAQLPRLAAMRGAERQARTVAEDGPGGLVHWLAGRTLASSYSFRTESGALDDPPQTPQSDGGIGPAGVPVPTPSG